MESIGSPCSRRKLRWNSSNRTWRGFSPTTCLRTSSAASRSRRVPLRVRGVARPRRRAPPAARGPPPALAGRPLHLQQRPRVPGALRPPLRRRFRRLHHQRLRGGPMQRPPPIRRLRAQPRHGRPVAASRAPASARGDGAFPQVRAARLRPRRVMRLRGVLDPHCVPLPHHLYHVAPPLDSGMLQSEWPPSPFPVNVLSSRTGRWEEGGEAAGTVADMQLDQRCWSPRRRAVCWHGALYVHQQTDFVMRISLSDHTYRVIKPPRGIKMFKRRRYLHLGRSRDGVYCALLDDEYRLWVWILDESCKQMEWVLRHDGSHGLPLR